ncbi:hypothetical protein PR048_003484 [Dryococelus australis]|uniref:Uncharacterized protein n=1 Tax=Dryococelus australis TaxID=614101 RepID=A0ABQ9IN73_9NEOP|nr:hypothetical protein PR048_003484 [Dryococelus australis]
MRVKRDEYEAVLECKGLGNRISPRKPADQQLRPARFPPTKIRQRYLWESNPDRCSRRRALELSDSGVSLMGDYTLPDESTMRHKGGGGGFEALSRALEDNEGNDGIMDEDTILIARDLRDFLYCIEELKLSAQRRYPESEEKVVITVDLTTVMKMLADLVEHQNMHILIFPMSFAHQATWGSSGEVIRLLAFHLGIGSLDLAGKWLCVAWMCLGYLRDPLGGCEPRLKLQRLAPWERNCSKSRIQVRVGATPRPSHPVYLKEMTLVEFCLPVQPACLKETTLVEFCLPVQPACLKETTFVHFCFPVQPLQLKETTTRCTVGTYEYGCQLVSAALALRHSCKLPVDVNTDLAEQLWRSWERLQTVGQEQMTRLRVSAVFHRSVQQKGSINREQLLKVFFMSDAKKRGSSKGDPDSSMQLSRRLYAQGTELACSISVEDVGLPTYQLFVPCHDAARGGLHQFDSVTTGTDSRSSSASDFPPAWSHHVWWAPGNFIAGPLICAALRGTRMLSSRAAGQSTGRVRFPVPVTSFHTACLNGGSFMKCEHSLRPLSLLIDNPACSSSALTVMQVRDRPRSYSPVVSSCGVCENQLHVISTLFWRLMYQDCCQAWSKLGLTSVKAVHYKMNTFEINLTKRFLIGWAARWRVGYQAPIGERRSNVLFVSDAILLACAARHCVQLRELVEAARAMEQREEDAGSRRARLHKFLTARERLLLEVGRMVRLGRLLRTRLREPLCPEHTCVDGKAVQCWDTEISCALPARSVYLILVYAHNHPSRPWVPGWRQTGELGNQPVMGVRLCLVGQLATHAERLSLLVHPSGGYLSLGCMSVVRPQVYSRAGQALSPGNGGISGISPGLGRPDQGLDSGWQWLITLMLGGDLLEESPYWNQAGNPQSWGFSYEGAQVWPAKKRTHLLSESLDRRTDGRLTNETDGCESASAAVAWLSGFMAATVIMDIPERGRVQQTIAKRRGRWESLVVSCVVWTNRATISPNTDTNRTGVLAVVDVGDTSNMSKTAPGVRNFTYLRAQQVAYPKANETCASYGDRLNIGHHEDTCWHYIANNGVRRSPHGALVPFAFAVCNLLPQQVRAVADSRRCFANILLDCGKVISELAKIKLFAYDVGVTWNE